MGVDSQLLLNEVDFWTVFIAETFAKEALG